MSGAEALGIIASTTQLAAYSIKIVLHLRELCKEVRGIPGRTNEQIIQVRELIETTTLIEQHQSLRSPAIEAQLQTTLDEARSLYSNLRDLAGRYNTNPLFRYWDITKGASAKAIHYQLEKLDRHKSTLKLCISLVHTDLLANIEGGIRSVSNSSMPRLADQSPPPSSTAVSLHTVRHLEDYGQEKNSKFKKMPEEERNHKLHDYAFAGNKKALSALLKADVNVEYRGPKGNTPLHRTIPGHHTECAALLLDCAADVDAQGAGNATPLILCAQHGDDKTAKLLLENGASTEKRNSSGETALMIASRDRQWLIVRSLLESGADVQAANDAGKTALMLASDNGHREVVSLLLEKGAHA
ncbi:MAG: hypothetical protein Q9191_004603 [Dirinaria sp. TL-2023a]